MKRLPLDAKSEAASWYIGEASKQEVSHRHAAPHAGPHKV
jgi:hypothetical protein